MFEIIVEKEGLEFLGWREVPTVPDVLGQRAIDVYAIYYAGICQETGRCTEKGIDFDRKLYIVRRIFEQSTEEYLCSIAFQPNDCYIKECSW